jgi:hypothetical protein
MTSQEPAGFESGWENPDHHPDLAKRARPMFDAKGRAVETPPEPEPLTAAERAMFAAMEDGGPVSGPAAVVVGERGPERIELPILARIRELVEEALESESAKGWIMALTDIKRELDS